MNRNLFSRRNFLEVVAGAGGIFLIRQTLGQTAQAAASDPHYLLLVYFRGAWDQLLALDPRDATDARYMLQPGGAPPLTGIFPAYTESAGNTGVAAVLAATGGKGVQRPSANSPMSFGPAVPQSLIAHANDLALVRGVNMETLTHEVGRRYLLTGKFPRGLAANGSSLNTVVSNSPGAFSYDIGNLAIDIESYNEGLPSKASATKVRAYGDLLTVLQSQAPLLSSTSDNALRAFEMTDDTCLAHGLNAQTAVNQFRDSRKLARTIVSSSKASLFDFRTLPTDPNSANGKLFANLGITDLKQVNGNRGNAAMAGQALTGGLSQVVAVTLADDLDDHFDLGQTHAANLREGFDSLGLLINHLKQTPHAIAGKSFWDFTTVLCFSEFARTPMLNTRMGRDHHLTSSLLLGGPGLKGNYVFGASSDVQMGVQTFDLNSGAPSPTGRPIRPVDVHATILESMGQRYGHLSNQNPLLIRALLKNP
jgi:uncharacterized protein (DUF1501 family)